MVVEQGQVDQLVKEEASIEEQVNTEEVLRKNYENLQNLVKQQQEQIQQLIKNQELNQKINQQLTETNKELVAKQTDNKHWVDRVLEENFDFQGKVDIDSGYYGKEGTEQVATWYLRYLKNQGISNGEISSRINNMFKGMSGEPQIHENVG